MNKLLRSAINHPARSLSCVAASLVIPLVVTACGEIKTNNKIEVAPIEVKPIQITVDVNLRVDRSLDDFFNYQRPTGPAVIVPGPATVPSTPPQ